MHNGEKLAIILPIYNPHKNWELRLVESLNELSRLFSGINYEIVLVNDGSLVDLKPLISFIIEKHRIKFIEYKPNQGKGYAIKTGVEATEADFFIYTDHDFPFEYDALVTIYNKLAANNCDLVYGKRNKMYFKSLPLTRFVVSKLLLISNYFLLGCRRIDTQAGLKGFNKKLKPLFLQTKTNGFIFEFEFLRKCVKNNFRLGYVNIGVNKNIHFSNFKISVFLKELKNYFSILLE
jgi:glycosyltransferase involved in cell wall biosynthesis